MKAFGQLKHEVARKVGVPVDGDYANTQIRDFLQLRYKQIWDTYNWWQTLELASVTVPADTNYFKLNKRFDRALALLNTGLDQALNTFDLTEFARRNLTGTTGGAAGILECAPLQAFGVDVQLTANDTLKIVSSSASDTSKVVYIEGILSTGEYDKETITTHASTPSVTQVAGTKSWSEIRRVGKITVPTAGTISIYRSDGTTLLATIGPFETSPQYRRYRAAQTSSSASTLTAVAKQGFIPFMDNAGFAFMDMDAALIAGATSDSWREHRQYELAAQEEAKFSEAVQDLIVRETAQSGAVEVFAAAHRC